MEKVFNFVNGLILKVVEIVKTILKLAIPTGIAMIVSDLFFKTNFNLIDRTVALVNTIGITKNLLSVLIIVALVIYWNNKTTK